jgi:UDP-N-acetylmuramate: L-alanyl-gamma-D-glutamyl-meso-diaminopimelate ligase
MKLYFMGIGGTAMGNAALLARAAGDVVVGSDRGLYPPMSDVLADAGIEVHEGYDAERLARLAPDLVVIGNAMSRGNPEVEWLLETRALPYTSLPALLSTRILAGRRPIVICGTHGKTTTTALTAFLLRRNGFDPGFLIGGVPVDPPVGHHLGAAGGLFVIEGDEYDSAFFDKRSKFIHYQPHVAVLNNLEFDHADIFRDLADVQRTFSHLTRIVPRSGFIVLNGDDENLRALGPLTWTQVVRVGEGEENDVRIEGFTESAAGSRFKLSHRGARWADVAWAQPGRFNARNAAMAATAAALATSPENPLAFQLASLAEFRGVRRRQELLVSSPALTVVEDFGHHPTALAETLRSFRARFPQAQLTAVFEPRSNTARTRVMQDDFTRALALADEIFLGAVNRADRLGESERFNVAAVTAALRGQGRQAATAETNAQLLQVLKERTLPASPAAPRVVIFFSNGAFDGIIAQYATTARADVGCDAATAG